MKLFSCRTILGVLVILIGIYILFQYIFQIYFEPLASFPIFNIVMSLIVLIWGISVILGHGVYSSKILIGILIVILSFYIFFRYSFNFNIPFVLYSPIFRVFISMSVIFLGVYIIIGANYIRNDIASYNNIFYKYNFKNNIVIDTTILDLNRNINFTVNATFSDIVVIISPDVAINIKGNSIFGTILFPTGDSLGFGEMNIIMNNDTDKILYLNLNSAFSQIRVLYKE